MAKITLASLKSHLQFKVSELLHVIFVLRIDKSLGPPREEIAGKSICKGQDVVSFLPLKRSLRILLQMEGGMENLWYLLLVTKLTSFCVSLLGYKANLILF